MRKLQEKHIYIKNELEGKSKQITTLGSIPNVNLIVVLTK